MSPSTWDQSNLKRVLSTCSRQSRQTRQRAYPTDHETMPCICFGSPLVAVTKVFHLPCQPKVHNPRNILLNSNSNHTNVTKHLKLIVLPGRCKTFFSSVYQRLKEKKRKKKYNPTPPSAKLSLPNVLMFAWAGRMSSAVLMLSSNRQ